MKQTMTIKYFEYFICPALYVSQNFSQRCLSQLEGYILKTLLLLLVNHSLLDFQKALSEY